MPFYKTGKAPIHGGRLNHATKKYQIPRDDWIDLSTGINPNGWPVPEIPANVFQRLPEDNDELNIAAQEYYQANNFIAVAGSQVAIQLLPKLRPHSRVAVIYPAYQEHAYCWHVAGHEVKQITPEEIDTEIHSIDVLILINPNNPTGKRFTTSKLLAWHALLASRKGWLIVDEAFLDGSPEASMIGFTEKKGLIVLRSIGKFFGLAGLRVGFVFAEEAIQKALAMQQGLWSISTPSRYLSTLALLDKAWQLNAQIQLEKESQRLAKLMAQHHLSPNGGTHLFQWVRHQNACQLFEHLAKQGILVRLFKDSSSIRLGLPKNKLDWARLEAGLKKAVVERPSKIP